MCRSVTDSFNRSREFKILDAFFRKKRFGMEIRMNVKDYVNQIHSAADYIRKRLDNAVPGLVIILGSGLGPLAGKIENPTEIPYSEIPHFPQPTVAGHEGKLIYGTLNGGPVLAMKGRFHYYEGYDMTTVTFPVRVFAALGISTLMVTNAAGGIKEGLKPGALMIINDQLSMFCPSVLRGPNLDEFGPRFKDMTEIYTPALIKLANEAAQKCALPVTNGTYCFFPGPQFETPAEIRALKILGADATGMSTVPETITARHSGMNVLGISLITNLAAGLSGAPLNHEEVLETGRMAEKNFVTLVKQIVKDFYNHDTQL